MLSFEPSVVFIDDKKEEVSGIINLYREEGVGVKFYNTDLINEDDKPSNPFSNVNLIFLDLYYSNDFDYELCVGWIDSILSENSFYVLVIWSKDSQHRNEIIDGLSRIGKKPFLDFNETKSGYKNKNNTYDWMRLKKKIDDGINKVSELTELSVWKKSVLTSSNVIVGHLSKDSDPEKLRVKLQKIILGHGGKAINIDNEEIRKRKILFDALDSVLIANTKGFISNVDVSDENKRELYKIPNTIPGDIDTKLNSWFHFKLLENIDAEEICPGLISLSKKQFLNDIYSIQDDNNFSSTIKPQTDSNKTITDIAVVLMRSCDFAQDKYGKNIKLLSGVLMKNPLRKDNSTKSIKTGQKYDSIKIFDHLTIEGNNDCTLIFDFRYIYSIPKSVFIKRFKNIEIFNKELLSELQVEYSSYSSRLGITQII